MDFFRVLGQSLSLLDNGLFLSSYDIRINQDIWKSYDKKNREEYKILSTNDAKGRAPLSQEKYALSKLLMRQLRKINKELGVLKSSAPQNKDLLYDLKNEFKYLYTYLEIKK